MPRPIKEINADLRSLPMERLPEEMDRLRDDHREGVKRLIRSYEGKHQAYLREAERLRVMRQYEDAFARKGYALICGVDEVGRGPLAGPVCAGAVILPEDAIIVGLDDSKRLNPSKRMALDAEIRQKAISCACHMVEPGEIDRINILQASLKAMSGAVAALSVTPGIALVDGDRLPELNIPMCAITGGDAKSVSIAAASIIAKVARDSLMDEYAVAYPGYGFGRHKGYGTREHIEAIHKLGACPIHRISFLKDEWLPLGGSENIE